MGKVIGGIAKGLIGPLFSFGLGKLFGGKKKETPQPSPLPIAQPDDAQATLQADDELRRRRGSAADILTGTRGAEALSTGGRLVRGN